MLQTRNDSEEIVAEGVHMEGAFRLLARLGVVTVPVDYDHRVYVAQLKERCPGMFRLCRRFVEASDRYPSHVLVPGESICVHVWEQVHTYHTFSYERIDFLRTQPRNVFLGAQGVALATQYCRSRLPKGRWYASYDLEEQLSVDQDGRSRVPGVGVRRGGSACLFDLGYFDIRWGMEHAFFGFSLV